MFHNTIIDKEYKKATTSIIAGVLLLVLTIGMLGASIIRGMQNKNEAVHLNEILVQEENRKDRISYIDVIGFYQIATYGDDLGYYIAYDEDYYYLVSIKEKDFDYFAKQFDTADTIRMWGTTAEIPYELKTFAIESLNEDFPDENITMDDFDGIFGDLLLEAGRDNSVNGLGGWFTYNIPLIVLGAFALVFGLILLFTGLSQRKSFDVLDDLQFGSSGLLEEINDPDTIFNKKASIYLTKNHLVNVKGRIDAVRYDDIFWVYTTNHRTNGIPDYDFLNVNTTDGRRLICANSPTLGKKRKEATTQLHEELMEELSRRNENIRFGYTKENIEAYQELKKK